MLLKIVTEDLVRQCFIINLILLFIYYVINKKNVHINHKCDRSVISITAYQTLSPQSALDCKLQFANLTKSMKHYSENKIIDL